MRNTVIVISALMISIYAYAIFSASMVFESNMLGNNNNGGGFVSTATLTTGVNYSTQAVAQVTYDVNDLWITENTTIIRSSVTPFGANHVGNVINISSGIGWIVQRAEIMRVVNSSATMDRTMGTALSENGIGCLGGAMGTTISTQTLGALQPGNTWYIQKGTYTLSATFLATNSGTVGNRINIKGYTTVRDDNPTIAENMPSITCIPGGYFRGLYHWSLAYTSWTVATTNGVGADDHSVINTCVVSATSTTTSPVGIYAIGNVVIRNCDVRSPRGVAIYTLATQSNEYGRIIGNYIHDSSTGIFNTIASPFIYNNLIINNSKVGIQINSGYGNIIGNTIYGTGSSVGIFVSGVTGSNIMNNLIYKHTNGIAGLAVNLYSHISNNDFWLCTTTFTVSVGGAAAVVRETDNLFTEPSFATGTQDWSIGTPLKGLGFPSLFLGTGTTSYLDIGAVQRQEPSGATTAPFYWGDFQ